METKVIVNVSAKEYFDFVISTIQVGIDLSEVENKTLRKGLKYTKPMKIGLGQSVNTHIEILDYVYPRVIEMKYKTNKQTNINKYLILPKGKDSCEVTYVETLYDQNNKIKPVNKLMEKSYIRKMEKRIKNVAKYLNENKQ